jgi:hypothetical protein
MDANENNLPESVPALRNFLASACQPPINERKHEMPNQPQINSGKNQRKSNSGGFAVLIACGLTVDIQQVVRILHSPD